MAVNKVIFNGDEIVNLTQDSAVENKVLEDYTFHKANGEVARGTYVPETPSGDDDYYILTIDTDLPLNIVVTPTKPSIVNRTGSYDYAEFIAGFKVGNEFHIPTYMMLQITPMDTPPEDYTLYINNEQVFAPILRGEKGKTYDIRLVINTVLDEPKQISASECKFADNVLTSCNQTNFSNNIILPSSYSKQSDVVNVDCRENGIENSLQLQFYLVNNNLTPPVTLTNGSNVLNIPSVNYFYEHGEEINQFFENAKYNWVLDPEQTGTYSYTIDGQIIEGDFGQITLIQGNINEAGSIIEVDGTQFNYDTTSSSYINSENKSRTYSFNISTNTLTMQVYNAEYIENWTVTLSYEGEVFIDGNDYQVTQLGDGNQPVFADQARNLRRIVIPNSYTSIAVNATQNCSFIEEYVLSSNLTEIGGLDGICKSLTLPNSLTSLSGWIRGMFKTLTIPSTVTNLENLDAPLLETLTIESNNLTSIGGELVIPSCKYITGFQNIQNFTGSLPSLLRVDSNEDGVLNLRGLTMINAPLFGYGIGNNAHTINFEHLESVQSPMLDRCPNMKNVVLPETLTSLNDIEISLGANIETLTLLSTTPPDLGFGVPMVNGRPRVAIYLNAIYVPAGSVQAYKEATNWTLYADLIQAKQ